jgi:hypothetical protein
MQPDVTVERVRKMMPSIIYHRCALESIFNNVPVMQGIFRQSIPRYIYMII